MSRKEDIRIIKSWMKKEKPFVCWKPIRQARVFLMFMKAFLIIVLAPEGGHALSRRRSDNSSDKSVEFVFLKDIMKYYI